MLYGVRHHIQLELFGEHTSGQIVEAIPAGTKPIHHSRYNNMSGSLPGSVDTYDLIVRFATKKGEYQSATTLTYYQIDELVDKNFRIKPISGRTVGVIYLPDDPARSQVDYALPWNDFWYPFVGGLSFTLLGAGLFFAKPAQPHTEKY
jgi:hypothetical protein